MAKATGKQTTKKKKKKTKAEQKAEEEAITKAVKLCVAHLIALKDDAAATAAIKRMTDAYYERRWFESPPSTATNPF